MSKRHRYTLGPRESRSRRRRDPYIAIMRAAALGCGVSLTPDEVCDLSLDDAIETRALNALSQDEFNARVVSGELPWSKVDPYAERTAGDGFATAGTEPA